MFLEFADKNTRLFKSGNIKIINEGKPFEIPDLQGQALLKAVTTENNGETRVPLFRKVEKEPRKSMLPDGFPMRDELEENKIYTMEQVSELKQEDHTKLKGIGARGMEKILSAAVSFGENKIVIGDDNNDDA